MKLGWTFALVKTSIVRCTLVTSEYRARFYSFCYDPIHKVVESAILIRTQRIEERVVNVVMLHYPTKSTHLIPFNESQALSQFSHYTPLQALSV